MQYLEILFNKIQALCAITDITEERLCRRDVEENKLQFIKSVVHPDKLKKEYEIFRKRWNDYYNKMVDDELESKEIDRENKESDLINEYNFLMYKKDFGMAYNDKDGNLNQRLKHKLFANNSNDNDVS